MPCRVSYSSFCADPLLWASNRASKLVDETIDLSGSFGDNSLVSLNVSLTNTANVQAASLRVYEGELVDEVLDVSGTTSHGDWSLTAVLTDVGNVVATDVEICNGEVRRGVV